MPVLLVSATRSAGHVALHQIHEPSGKRIRYDKVAEGVGSVDRDEIKKGVEVSKGKYVILEDEEIEKLKVEGKRVLELVQFVDAAEIDPIWYEKPYFLLPDGETGRGALWRDPRCSEGRAQGRRRPVRHARARLCRGAQAVRRRAHDRDAPLCR